MKKKTWIFIICIILASIGIGVFIYNKNQKNNSEEFYEANRTSASDQSNNSDANKESTNEDNSIVPETQKQENNITTVTQNATSTQPPPEPEKEIASFSTKIYTKDPARQNNITITCNTLNGTIVKNGETFSFCNTVGPSFTSKGYQKADIFDNNGNKTKGLGGGNCQISTTLYNAVLLVSSLVVTERHAHSNYVPYIQRGKDAAVAYGSYDLKFRNDTGKDIKILAQSSADAVTIKLLQ